MEIIEEERNNTFIKRFTSTSRIWRLSAILCLLGFILHIISYGTPFWIVAEEVANSTYIGIWNKCTSIATCTFRNSNAVRYRRAVDNREFLLTDIIPIFQSAAFPMHWPQCQVRLGNEDCLVAVRVFHGMATIGGLLVITLMVLYVGSSKSRKQIAMSSTVVCFVSALCIQVGTGLFGKSHACDASTNLGASSWSWSLALSVTSVILLCAVVFLLVLDQIRTFSKKEQPLRKNGYKLGLIIT